jgi:hypothetical protein
LKPPTSRFDTMLEIKKLLLVWLALMALIVALSAHAEDNVVRAPDFAPGQVWSIKSDSPTTAKVIIGRIEPWKDKVAVHCTVIEIPLPKRGPNDAPMTQIDHIPFDKPTLAASVDKLLSAGVPPVPGFERGYVHWRSDANAGVFAVSVSKAIGLMLESIIRGART